MSYATSNITGEGLRDSNLPSSALAINELWAKGVEVYEQTTDFFAPMEGGKDAVVETISDTSKGRGQKITFTQMAGLYNEPKHGDEQFDDGDAFETIKLHTYDLSVDFLRHGVRYTERSEEFMGMRGEINIGVPRELGKWMGRQKSEKLFMSFLHHGNAANQLFANNKANIAALRTADVFDWDTIVAANTQLSRLGGQPAKVGTDANGNPILRYCAVATTDTLFSLEQDGDYKSFLVEGGERGMGNYIFGGGYVDVRGNIIKKYNPIDHDGWGAVGSPLNPKAFLGRGTTDGFTNVTAGTALRIYGGGDTVAAALTQKAYFKYFPLYAFKFLANDTLSLASSLYGSGNFYVAVVNPPNAAVDPGKIGFYVCSANSGNLMTVADKLVSSDTTLSDAWAGSPAWNAAIHTNTHAPGATIYLVNASGVPIGHSLLLGKAAARRGYGKHRNNRTEDSHEGGFVKDIFITSVFGQEPCEDAAGRKPGYMIVTHAMQYAGVPFPTVA